MNTSPDTAISETREKLLAAAAQAFFESGYGASMDVIAARAGVAKQTLYNHFSGKDDLFRHVVRSTTERVVVALNDEGDLRMRLIRFATTFRAMVLGAECIALYRTLVAEAPRFPQAAQAFYDVGPGQAIRQLSALLAPEIVCGRLRQSNGDPASAAIFAAEMLLGMLTGVERTRTLMGIRAASDEDNEAHATRIVDCFLRAFAPIPDKDL